MITSIDFSKVATILAAKGLASNQPLRELGRTVVLTGPNGSGKTRFLNLVAKLAEHALNEHNLGSDLTPSKKRMHNEGRLRQALERGDKHTADQAHQRLQAIDALEALTWKPISKGPRTVHLSLPRSTQVSDASKMVDDARARAVEECCTPGLETAYRNQHAYLVSVAGHLLLAETERLRTDSRLQELHVQAQRLATLIRTLLDTELTWTMGSGGIPTPQLFGRDFTTKELSEGQKVLLAWAIALHRQSDDLRDAIVLIDEPENHLHPEVCIRTLQRLRDEVLGEHGQIWLATHSIPLLSWGGVNSLYVTRDGVLEYAGSRVSHAVEALLGGPEGRERLHVFLSDADRLGFFHFVAQCLGTPAVLASKGEDPQESSLAQLVARLSRSRERLKLLDFGAGRARLAQALTRAFGGEQEVLAKLTYLAFDSSSEFGPERSGHVEALRASGADARVMTDLREARLPGEQVNLIVMCNVLHEVPPDDWASVFQDCQACLAEGGSLVIIEDQKPAVGELPHSKGFLVLDLVETKALFGADSGIVDLSASVPERYRDRVSMFEVPASALNAFSRENQRKALEFLRRRARDQVEALRTSGDPTQRAGRLHALYAMLWMNAEFALEKM